jgi:hypothetical protein
MLTRDLHAAIRKLNPQLPPQTVEDTVTALTTYRIITLSPVPDTCREQPPLPDRG